MIEEAGRRRGVMRWFNIVGLVFDFAGTIVIALSVIPSRSEIDEMTRTVYGGNPTARADRLRQSNLALAGLGLLIVGFLLQIIGDGPK
jgi:hypothetical protein